MVWADGTLYVAATDAILAYPYTLGQDKITAAPTVLTPLPGGPIDHHWTKDLALSPDGKSLFVSVGSNSNITENGLEAEKGRAAIWQVDRQTGAARVFASGLRNPNGLSFEPETGALWAVVNERDELGPNLVPDYMTSVKDGAFYGWPWSYYGDHVDKRVYPQRPDMVAKAIPPDYALSSHVAPLGMTFSMGSAMPAPFANGAFVGEHGSWNRGVYNGYKVIFVPFQDGKPNGHAGGRGDRLHRRRARPGAWAAGRGRDRRHRGAAGGGRCRQYRVAGRGGGRVGDAGADRDGPARGALRADERGGGFGSVGEPPAQTQIAPAAP